MIIVNEHFLPDPEHVEEAEPRMLYHYTSVDRLPAICAQGLRSDAPPRVRRCAKRPTGGAVYAMTFVTPGRLKEIVLCDLPAAHAFQPVVLRFPKRGRWMPDREVNEPRGVSPTCVWRRKPVPPEDIEIAYCDTWMRLAELEEVRDG